MRPGNAVSEEEVPKTRIISSFKYLISGHKRKRFNRNTVPKTRTMNAIIVIITQTIRESNASKLRLPYLPTTKAIAAKAANGANCTTIPTIRIITFEMTSSISVSFLPFSPIPARATPVNIATSNTCKISPETSAPRNVLGIKFIK